MYKDLIFYELNDGVEAQDLLKITHKIIDWMRTLKGFIAWEINHLEGRKYVDIVYWETEKDAENAKPEMRNVPNGVEWYNCYKPKSTHTHKLHLIQTLKQQADPNK